MNRLAITRVEIKKKLYIAYILMDENRDMVDFQLFPEEEESLLNQIRIGRVENIVPNINAAFVRIDREQMSYLSLEDLRSPIFAKKQSVKKDLCIGDEVFVQVIKEAVKTKDPVVSTKLTLTGTYCLLTTNNTALSISKKIVGDKRSELSKLLEEVKIQAETLGFGVILRTNSAEDSLEEVRMDLQKLIKRLIKLKEQGIHQTAFSVLSKDDSAYIRKLKSLDIHSVDCIYTDETEIYENIAQSLPYLTEQKLLQLYNDPMVSLKTLYHIEGNIDNLLSRKVWLKSGANIIIEQLETMTVIDVNSAKNMSRNEATICNINKEAAKEIARQLKLRNISGMILIDFINMKSEDQTDAVVQTLKAELKKDAVSAQFIDVTKLGLVEVTRKKINKSLLEVVK